MRHARNPHRSRTMPKACPTRKKRWGGNPGNYGFWGAFLFVEHSVFDVFFKGFLTAAYRVLRYAPVETPVPAMFSGFCRNTRFQIESFSFSPNNSSDMPDLYWFRNSTASYGFDPFVSKQTRTMSTCTHMPSFNETHGFACTRRALNARKQRFRRFWGSCGWFFRGVSFSFWEVRRPKSRKRGRCWISRIFWRYWRSSLRPRSVWV